MDVKGLQARLAAFAVERGWDELHSPRNLAIAIAGEAGSLLDLFRWLTDARSHRIESEYKRDAAEEAIADLVLHTLRIADKLGIDVERAVAKKLAENDANYPAPVAAPPPRPEPPPPPEPLPVEAPRAERRAKAAAVAKEPPPAAELQASPVPEKKETPPAEPQTPEQAVDEKAPAPLPESEERAPAPEAANAQPARAVPTWLDGLLPSRAAAPRRKHAAETKPAPRAAKLPEPAPPLPTAPVAQGERAQPPVAAPEPAVAPAPEHEPELIAPFPEPAPELEPEREPERAPEPERYAHLDPDAAKGLAKALAKRVDSARSTDPLLRELHDEVETLRRTLYSPTPKRSWMADSLKTIRAMLEEAATHEVGEAIRARDHIAQIDRMLNP
jgi:NTP pyrophosphatase (non-canonical NTP hydrolase)